MTNSVNSQYGAEAERRPEATTVDVLSGIDLSGQHAFLSLAAPAGLGARLPERSPLTMQMSSLPRAQKIKDGRFARRCERRPAVTELILAFWNSDR